MNDNEILERIRSPPIDYLIMTGSKIAAIRLLISLTKKSLYSSGRWATSSRTARDSLSMRSPHSSGILPRDGRQGKKKGG